MAWVASLRGAVVSSLDSRRMAPLVSPSSILAEARADSTLTAERCFRWPRKATTVAGSDCKFGYSLSALLALEVKLDWRFLPPRSPGALKHIGAHSSRFLHATKLVESFITAASNDASFSAALARDDRHHLMSQIQKSAFASCQLYHDYRILRRSQEDNLTRTRALLTIEFVYNTRRC
jgi:hypothetical protein